MIVIVVLGILVVFAVVTLVNMNPSLLAPSGYPPFRDIVSSVALTFFAFLGFGIITFTAKDLDRPAYGSCRGRCTSPWASRRSSTSPSRSASSAPSPSSRSSPRVAPRWRSPPSPTLGQAGYWLMSVTALFATAGATNAGLYPAPGLSERTGRRPGSSPR